MGWKVYRLPKKELCHSNGTSYALNSTFPHTNCIVSFQVNPHWISNSGLWEVVLETFQNGLDCLFVFWTISIQDTMMIKDEGSPVSPGQADKSVVAKAVAWRWLWTGWSPSMFSWFGTIWLLSVPQPVKQTLGWESVSDGWWAYV